MNDDKAWDRMTDAIEARFGLIDHGRSKRAIADAPDHEEAVAFIVFERDGERYKLERVTGPAIVDRKTIGARRAGAEVRFENVYDFDEVAHRTNLYRQSGDDWDAVDVSTLGM